jgi:two-component system KDP operon response regulator KdpE
MHATTDNSPSNRDGQAKKLLIVEDFDTLRALVARRFKSQGFDVDSADSLAGALSLVTEHNPEVVLVDCSLRNSDAIRTIEQIRLASPKSFVVLAGCPDGTKIAERALEAGAKKVVTKSDDPRMIDDLVGEVIGLIAAD